jgi:hypothetical protein
MDRRTFLASMGAAAVLLGACTAAPEANRAENASLQPAPTNQAASAGGDAGMANAASAETPAPTVPAMPELNSCNRGECSWSVTRSQDLVRRTAAGSLYRLSLLGGASEHPDENYPEDRRGVRIAWNAAPHEVFVFCARRLPAVILPTEGRLQVDVLDFVTGPVPALESSAAIYTRVCHPGDDWASEGFAERFGYSAREDEADIDIARPEDIFQRVR